MVDYAEARLNMVDCQLRTNKVTDEAVLDAFLNIPRERFVPPAARGVAYVDDDIPLGRDRALMAPMVLARLVQLAAIGPVDKVLEIGCGTGYATAVLARLAAHVTALECDPGFAAAARALLGELGCVGLEIVSGPLAEGWPPKAPYDVILFGGAVEAIPPAIAAQLGEGGRLVAVVAPREGTGQAVLMMREEGALSSRPAFDAAIAALPGFERAPSFVF